MTDPQPRLLLRGAALGAAAALLVACGQGDARAACTGDRTDEPGCVAAPTARPSQDVDPTPSASRTTSAEDLAETVRRSRESLRRSLETLRRLRVATGSPRPVPPPTAPPAPAPEPAPVPGPTGVTDGLEATWTSLAAASVGDSRDAAAAALGVTFTEVWPLTAECSLAVTADRQLGVVTTDPGGVRAFVVSLDGSTMVSGTSTPVGVGSTLQDVRAAFPDWYSGSDYLSEAGGERALIAPRAYPGSAALFEADEDGVVQQFRVGDADYVGHTKYCSTPG